MPSIYINDGFTLKGEIKGSPHLYPAVRFDYRASRTSELMRWQNAPTVNRERVAAEIVCAHIDNFEAQNDDGTWERVAFKADEAVAFQPDILLGALDFVLGLKNPVARTQAPK